MSEVENAKRQQWSQRANILMMAILVALCIATFLVTRRTSQTLTIVAAEWFIWLSVAQAVSMGVVFAVFRLPQKKLDWVVCLTCNSVLIALSVLAYLHLLDKATVYGFSMLLRVALTALWAMATIGGLLSILWLWRRRKSSWRIPGIVPKLWFASLVTLLVAEPAAMFLESRATVRLPEFTAEAPAGEIHIAAIGGSTMMGHPYEPKFGIPSVCEWKLRQMYPDQKIVVHNVAVEQINFETAVYRLREMPFKPHHILVYSGHNEFYHEMDELRGSGTSVTPQLDRVLIHSPTFRLLNRPLARRLAMQDLVVGRRLFDRPIAQPDIAKRRALRFETHLRLFAQFCKDSDIFTQWFIPAGSESGFEPSRSVLRPGTSRLAQRELREQFEAACKLQTASKWKEASRRFAELVKKQPGFGEFRFRYAQCLLKLGETNAAQKEFALAADGDYQPTRCNSEYRKLIAGVADEFNIPTVDAAKVLRPHTEHGILDRSLFHDNVHPTLKAFHVLGDAAANAIAQKYLEPKFGKPKQVAAALPASVKAMEINREDLAKAYERTAFGLRQLGTLRFDPADRLAEHKRFLKLANQLRAGEIDPGQNGTEPLE